ncbi:MAG: hypothetical protein M1833_006970 [Piccolia ochrophora]|nr:MAG: hypothetical protein M1833_006970 [Piccolia ochrophora]
MSSSPPGGSGDAEVPKSERRQSLTRYLSKAKTVLKRDKKRQSISETSPTGSASPSSSQTPTSKAGDVKASIPESTPAKKAAPATTEQKVLSAPNMRSAVQQERARALFEKYGFTLEPSEWALPSREQVERVEKPIRMRVHRQCHRCQTTFGVDKVCAQCTHKRCKKCPRYPVKKPKQALDKGKSAGTMGTITEAGKPKVRGKGKLELTMPPKTGGQDRVRKEIKQRITRTCHKCEKQFDRGEKLCTSCNHNRCTLCPREPAKLHKYPNGYPGDAQPSEDERELVPKKERTYKKTRRVVKITCHSCDQLFTRGSKVCASCDHERCEQCPRVPPKKVKPPPDPAVVKSVEDKLAAMDLGGEPSAQRA